MKLLFIGRKRVPIRKVGMLKGDGLTGDNSFTKPRRRR